MTWRKHFRLVNVQNGIPQSNSALPAGKSGGGAATGAKFSSYLPEVYAGHPNRLQRYMQYEDMDRDSTINAALDTIADFCTQSEEQNDSPFLVKYNGTANETEVKIIKASLDKWVKLNDFRARLWYMFRGVIKNGDQFFVRDPETKEWLWIDQFNVELVRVDEEQGKVPMHYVIRNLDYNKINKLGAAPANADGSSSTMSLNRGPVQAQTAQAFQMQGAGRDSRNSQALNESYVVDADHVVHLSLSVGMDANWPFGASILEAIFKTYKQKELLEDAVIIYRVQRAPERRIFKIDVGDMNPVLANAHVERIKNEVHQRRIPNRTGGGTSILDAAYNPLSMMEDYFFAQSSDGRGSSVDTLSGGEQTGEIGDLQFFDKKLREGLRIPAAYAPGGDQDMSYNDGRLGSAMIQEYMFNKYCMRLQSLMAPKFDDEFKRYLKDNGIQIESDLFELTFNPPQNFSKYRQIELDNQQMGVYSQVADNKRLSERFKLKRFLNLTEEEILENERMWAEENPGKVKAATGGTEMSGGGAGGAPDGLGEVGIRSGEEGDFEGDGTDTEAIGDDMGDAGGDADFDLDTGGDDTGASDETL